MNNPKLGDTKFSVADIQKIKSLANKKIGKPQSEQKLIRDEIRTLKFYWTDFLDTRPGYSSKHIDELIKQGKIKIK